MLVYLRDGSAQTIFTYCHTEMEVADSTFYLTQSQHTDTGPTSSSADPIMPGAWQGSPWSAHFLSHWYDSTTKKIPAQAGFEPGIFRSRGGHLTTRPKRRWQVRKADMLTVTPRVSPGKTSDWRVTDLGKGSDWRVTDLGKGSAWRVTDLGKGSDWRVTDLGKGSDWRVTDLGKGSDWRVTDLGKGSDWRVTDLGKGSDWRVTDLGSIPEFPVALFPAPCVLGSALGLAGPVSICCD